MVTTGQWSVSTGASNIRDNLLALKKCTEIEASKGYIPPSYEIFYTSPSHIQWLQETGYLDSEGYVTEKWKTEVCTDIKRVLDAAATSEENGY